MAAEILITTRIDNPIKSPGILATYIGQKRLIASRKRPACIMTKTLLTTDGMMSEAVRGKKVDKEYYAQIDGLISDTALEQLKKGVEIGFNGKRYTTKKCLVKRIADPLFPERSQKIRDAKHGPTEWISITLNEGKFRQVRKMTAAVGYPTLRLVRVRIGKYSLTDLKPGLVTSLKEISV